MNELKFTCPSCGQHIQCDGDCAGENVPCPTCAKQIRVPYRKLTATKAPSPKVEPEKENPFQMPARDSTMVSYSAKPHEEHEQHEESRDVKSDAPAEKSPPKEMPEPVREQPAPVAAKPEPVAPKLEPVAQEPEPAVRPVDVHCLCPVCQSELRIPNAGANTGGEPPIAELVHTRLERSTVTTEAHPPDPYHAKPAPVLTKEREEKIAHAREERPISIYPAMKPRLDYVLSGGEAASPEHSSGQAPAGPDPADKTKSSADDKHSLTE